VLLPDGIVSAPLPLVIFLHGWQGTNPKNFGALIDHLTRRGAVVIYPVYQRNGQDDPQLITATAQASIAHALRWLASEHPGLVRSETAIYYGFSIGATMAVNLAAGAPANRMPRARVLLLSAPGDALHVHRGSMGRSILQSNLNRLPLSLPIVLMTGAEDETIGVPTATAFWNQICNQPRKKNLIIWPRGSNGTQDIRAGHGMPGAPDSRYDIEDFYTPWEAVRILEAQPEFPTDVSLNLLDFHGQWKVITTSLDSMRDDIPLPQWMFEASPVLKSLGRFNDGTSYPEAYFGTACPIMPSR
jgi:dienelactone hydrolase